MRSSFSLMSPLTLTDKQNRSSFSYTQKFLNGRLQSSNSNNEKSKSSSNSKSGSRNKTIRTGGSDEDFNEDSIISNNKYYEIFRDQNPVPHLFKLLKVHFRNANPSKPFH